MDDTAPTDFLSKVPCEIKTSICEFLCDHCCEDWLGAPQYLRVLVLVRTESLRNLCLTSKAMKPAAQRTLLHCKFLLVGCERFHKRTIGYLAALQKYPEFAGAVKSLVIESGSLGFELGANPQDIDCLEDAEKGWRILMSSNRIKELDITYRDICSSSEFACSSLEELSLHYMNSDSSLSARQISAFLAHCHNLKKLTLSNVRSFHRSISNAVSNIRQLTLIHNKSGVGDIQTLVAAMPRLECFRFCNSSMNNNEIHLRDVVNQLLSRKDDLKSLTLARCRVGAHCNTLSMFSKVEHVDLQVLSLQNLSGSGALEFPKSMKRIVFRVRYDIHHGNLGKFASLLCSRVDLFPNLERVDVVIDEPLSSGGFTKIRPRKERRGRVDSRTSLYYHHASLRPGEDYTMERGWGNIIGRHSVSADYLVDEYSKS